MAHQTQTTLTAAIVQGDGLMEAMRMIKEDKSAIILQRSYRGRLGRCIDCRV